MTDINEQKLRLSADFSSDDSAKSLAYQQNAIKTTPRNLGAELSDFFTDSLDGLDDNSQQFVRELHRTLGCGNPAFSEALQISVALCENQKPPSFNPGDSYKRYARECEIKCHHCGMRDHSRINCPHYEAKLGSKCTDENLKHFVNSTIRYWKRLDKAEANMAFAY